jgi:hypothetical protein
MNVLNVTSKELIKTHSFFENPPKNSFGGRLVTYGKEIAGDLFSLPASGCIPYDSLFSTNSTLGFIGALIYGIKDVCTAPSSQTARVIKAAMLIGLGRVCYEIERRLPLNSQADRLEKEIALLETELKKLETIGSIKQEVIHAFVSILDKYKEVKTLSEQVETTTRSSSAKLEAINSSLRGLEDILLSIRSEKMLHEAIEETIIPFEAAVDSLLDTIAELVKTDQKVLLKEEEISKRVTIQLKQKRNEPLITLSKQIPIKLMA